MRIIGEAGIEIEPVADGFASDLGRQLERDVRAAADGVDVPPIEVGLEAITDELRRDVARTVREIESTISAEIPLDADGIVFREQVARAVTAVEASLEANIPVEPAELAAFAARVRSEVADVERVVRAQIPVDLDPEDSAVGLGARVKAIAASIRPTINVDLDIDRGRIGRLLGGVVGLLGGATRGVLALGVAGPPAAAGLASLGSVLAGLVSIVSSLSAGLVVVPGLIAGVIGIVAGLKIGLSGVSDALSSAFDPSKAAQFEEAVSKLAPSAQETVRAIRGLGPAFREMRLDVQGQLFENLGGRIERVGTRYMPVLRDNLRQVTSAFNAGAQKSLDFLDSGLQTAQVGAILGNTAGMARGLGAAMQPALEGLLAMANVGSAQLPGIGDAIRNAAVGFRDWAVAARDSGRLQEMIDGAKETLSQLGQVGSNVGSILGQMWTVAGASGAGFLTGLVSLTGQLDAFVHSAAGVQLLGGVFSTIAAGAEAFRAILGAVLPALAPIIGAVGQLAVSIGGALGQALSVAAPALEGLGQSLGMLIGSLAPFIGQLIGALGPVLAQVAGMLGQLASTLMSALGPVLPVIASAFGQLAAAVGPVVQALGAALGPVLSALAPVLGQLASVLAGVLVQAFNALAPVLPVIGQAFGAWATALGPALGALLQLVGALVSGLLPVLGPIATALSQYMVTGFSILAPILQAITPIIGELAGLLAGVLSQALAALAPIFPVIADAAMQILGAFLPLLPVIGQLAQAVLPPLLDIFLALVPAIIPLVQAIGQIVTAVVQVVGPVIAFVAQVLGAFASLVGGVLAFVAGLVAGVVGFFATLLGGVIGLVGSIVGGVLGFFSNLLGGAIGLVGSLVGGVIGAFGRMLSGTIAAISALVGGVLGAIAGMISGALGALSGWVGRMVGVGRDVIGGIVSGLRSAAGAVTDFLLSMARNALNAVKSFFGIASPSKVFAGIGRDLGRGLIVGLDRIGPNVIATAKGLADDVRKAAAAEIAVSRVDRPTDLIRTASAITDLGSTVRPAQGPAAQAPPTAAEIGAAVYDAQLAALDGARMEVEGSGLARLVTRGQRENSRR